MSNKNLGSYSFSFDRFDNLNKIFKEFHKKSFTKLSILEKSNHLGQKLLSLIQNYKPPCFLLYAIIEFINRIDNEKILPGYSLTQFELFLNQFANLSFEEEHLVRGKIVGKYIPRGEYQTFFPIGMKKMYDGPHIVTAHSSPDLDTIVASFWGWVDAFACKVGTGLHIWNVPGGAPNSIVEIDFLFTKIFCSQFFEIAAKTRTSLAVTGIDLVKQKNVITKTLRESTISVDHERHQNAIVVLDDKGLFIGDWRTSDVEGMRQVVSLINNCLRAFETNLQAKIISLFAKKTVTKKEMQQLIEEIFAFRIDEIEPAKEFSEKQKEYLDKYLTKVLSIKEGIKASFATFAQSLKTIGYEEFLEVKKVLEKILSSNLFNKGQKIVEDRPIIFHQLEEVIISLQNALRSIREYFDSMEVAMHIKEEVYEHLPQYVTLRTDVSEIKSKMQNYQHLSVIREEKKGQLVHYGVIFARDVLHDNLGTVSVRDFSNRQEVSIPSFLQVISVIDHHKTNLQTDIPTQTTIQDAQSANVLVAEKTLQLNEKYSLEGMEKKQIEAQLRTFKRRVTNKEIRQKQRLLDKLHIVQKKQDYFVHPDREFLEYLHFIYAILDDTDLLTKVSYKDVEIVTQILNRMRSVQEKKQVDMIDIESIQKDDEFAKKAADRILRNKQMYSLYKRVYIEKEKMVEQNILQCIKNKPTNFFEDTKLQSSYARVGQSKMFENNIHLYLKNEEKILKVWVKECSEYYNGNEEVDLHLHMVSTIRSAEDVFKGHKGEYKHEDELWIWIPESEQAHVHLKRFLNAFSDSPGLKENQLSVEFLGNNAKLLEELFSESFLKVPTKTSNKGIPIAILRYRAGSINSRKAMISPFIPRLVS